MITSNIKQLVTITSLAVLLSACATSGPVPTLPAGKSMTVAQPVIKRIDSAVDSKAMRAGRGAALGAVGAVGGAAVGSSMGGLLGFACGPAAIICVPVGLAAGAGIGGVGGGVMGAGYGGQGGISGDKAKQFNAVAAELMDEAQLGNRLHTQFSASASEHWVLGDDGDNTVVLEINSLQFKQLGNEEIQLSIKAEMHVASNGRTRTVAVEQDGVRRHIDYWLDGEGGNFRAEIEDAMQAVAQTMVNRMVAPEQIAQR
jgi:hypothetical protein